MDGSSGEKSSREQQESARQQEEAESEVMDILMQVLDDVNPALYNTDMVLQRMREECGEECTLRVVVTHRVEMYRDAIVQNIDAFVSAKRKETSDEDISNETTSNPSLDAVYTISSELQSITGKEECTGREVCSTILSYAKIIYAVWKYIYDNKLADPHNPENLLLDNIFAEVECHDEESFLDCPIIHPFHLRSDNILHGSSIAPSFAKVHLQPHCVT